MEKFFTHIESVDLPLALPESEVWSRLGRNRFLSRIEPSQERTVKLAMHRAFALCKPRGRYCLLKIASRSAEYIELSDGVMLQSRAFAEFASSADYLWVGAVTVGEAVLQAVSEENGKLSERAIFDAVGSEAADQAMDMLQKIAMAKLLRHDLKLSMRRFSPGYGNLALSVQKNIFQYLKLHELGLSLTESFIMQPEKSVTAFAVVNK